MKTVLSFGAGVQTTALLVLIGRDTWPRPDAIAFADTGSEKAATYAYLADIVQPYAREHGLEIVRLGADWRKPSYAGSLEDYCLEHRMLPGTWNRWCTSQYKLVALARFRRRRFAASPSAPVESWIGISTDEGRRAVPSVDPAERKRYPLIELGLSREDCRAVIDSAGLPIPVKSGCWFCPFQRRAAWQTLKRVEPDLFARALRMEQNAAVKRDGAARYLPMFGSLNVVAAQGELPGFDAAVAAEGGCVAGACFV